MGVLLEKKKEAFLVHIWHRMIGTISVDHMKYTDTSDIDEFRCT